MFWILPLLAGASLAGLWLREMHLRRTYETLCAEGRALLCEAKYALALERFDDAYRTAARVRLGFEDERVESALYIAETLDKLGESSAALEAAESAMSLAQQHDRNAPYRMRLFTLMADLSEKNGLGHRAIGLRQTAVALYRETFGVRSPRLAEQLQKLAGALELGGLPGHAAKAYQEACKITEESPDCRETHAACMAGLGHILVQMGDADAAETTLKAALALQRDIYGDRDEHTAQTLAELAALYGETGHYDDAVRCFEEAYRVQSRLYGPNDARVGLILSSYAGCLRKAGRLDGATDAATRAVKLLEMHAHPALANSLGNLGAVLMAGGDYHKALDAFERADAALISAPSSVSPLDTAQRLEDHADTLDHLQRALEAERLRSGAASIRSTLASVPPAEQLLDPAADRPESPSTLHKRPQPHKSS